MHGYKNYSEDIVEDLLFKILQKYPNVCKCDKCVSDMMALSLNCVKPKYVASEQGMIYTKALNEVDKQEQISISAAIIKAIEQVTSNPKH